MLRVFILTFFVIGPGLAQDLSTMILAANRSGAIELIDPATLATVSRIPFGMAARSAGLNGIWASSDGATLYIDGPMQANPRNCCELYSMDLATRQTKVVASTYGSTSRTHFLFAGGSVYPATALIPGAIPRDLAGDRFQLSSTGAWLAGLKAFGGPALDLFDLVHRGPVRQLVWPKLEGDWWPSGTWSGDRFYVYASNAHGDGRLWSIRPEAPELDDGVAVPPLAHTDGCPDGSSKSITATGGRLFLYEPFGFKIDRRDYCLGVAGGAWEVDPVTGRLLRQLASDRYFAALLPVGTNLYGLSTGSAAWDSPELLRIDPASGRVVQSRILDPGFWRVAIAPVRLTSW